MQNRCTCLVKYILFNKQISFYSLDIGVSYDFAFRKKRQKERTIEFV